MSLLTHANTMRVYDFGQTDDGLLYLVMEFLEGELITQRVARLGPLPVLEALRITQQILRSLAEAHTKGIVHRDLKPDNIFVARVAGHRTAVVKVLDFGIAKIVTPDRAVDQFETQAGTVFGTPRYMSPEQAQGAPLDRRSDLYSVGAMLYQMLTGRAPFTDDDAVVVMAKHIREMPEPPRQVVPERPIPEKLEAVVMRSLAKEPDQRFQTARIRRRAGRLRDRGAGRGDRFGPACEAFGDASQPDLGAVGLRACGCELCGAARVHEVQRPSTARRKPARARNASAVGRRHARAARAHWGGTRVGPRRGARARRGA